MELVNEHLFYSGVVMVQMPFFFFSSAKHEKCVEFFIFSPVLITEKKMPDKLNE